MFKIESAKFDEFIASLKRDYTLFAPSVEDSKPAFREVESVGDMAELSGNPVRSPKELFFPQTEVLFTYDGQSVESVENNNRPLAVWGVRSCDASGLSLVNRVMGDAKQKPGDSAFQDPLWKARYGESLIIVLACNTPDSTCFCHWTGGGPFEKTGADLWAVDTGDGYLIESVSDKGEAFLKKADGLSQASADDKKRIPELKYAADEALSDRVDAVHLSETMKTMWDDPAWSEISGKCVNCGACTFACPPCHCFDVQDEGKKGKGKRLRIWDSCMFPQFTMEASGHNPRALSRDRVRQRYMHKFSYFYDNYGHSLCTGCGRCIHVCPVNLDIRNVVTRFTGGME